MRADLHCHTKISDGSLGIGDILVVADRLKIKCLAITDQDTMGAVSRACVEGKRRDIEVIPGVELSAYDYEHGKSVHLLCYLPDYPDRMEGYFKRMADERMRVFNLQIKRICEKLPISPPMVLEHTRGCTTVFPCHIMRTLMDCGYTNEIYGGLYNALFGKDKLCGDIHCEYGDYREVMQLIKSAGGLAILAHPGAQNTLDMVEQLIECGLDGIELEHHGNSEQVKQQIRDICKQNKLIVTGGSDFHGIYETPVRPLGSNLVTEVEVKALYDRKQEQKKATVNV